MLAQILGNANVVSELFDLNHAIDSAQEHNGMTV